MNGLKLLATGRCLPKTTVSNEEMSRWVDTSDEWIASRTGIRQRYFCGEGETALTLAAGAARQALARSGIDPAGLGCVLCATVFGRAIGFDWLLGAGSLLLSVAIAVIASIPPVRRATRIDPAIVLREE